MLPGRRRRRRLPRFFLLFVILNISSQKVCAARTFLIPLPTPKERLELPLLSPSPTEWTVVDGLRWALGPELSALLLGPQGVETGSVEHTSDSQTQSVGVLKMEKAVFLYRVSEKELVCKP